MIGEIPLLTCSGQPAMHARESRGRVHAHCTGSSRPADEKSTSFRAVPQNRMHCRHRQIDHRISKCTIYAHASLQNNMTMNRDSTFKTIEMDLDISYKTF